MRAIIENMISPDYVLCYIPQAMAILRWKWNFWNLLVRRRWPLWCRWRPHSGFGNFEEKYSRFWNFFPETLTFLKIFKNMSYNFQSRKQILMLRGVYQTEIFEMHFHFLLHSWVRPTTQQIYKRTSSDSIRKHRKNCECFPGHYLNRCLCSHCSHCSQCLLVFTSVY